MVVPGYRHQAAERYDTHRTTGAGTVQLLSWMPESADDLQGDLIRINPDDLGPELIVEAILVINHVDDAFVADFNVWRRTVDVYPQNHG